MNHDTAKPPSDRATTSPSDCDPVAAAAMSKALPLISPPAVRNWPFSVAVAVASTETHRASNRPSASAVTFDGSAALLATITGSSTGSPCALISWNTTWEFPSAVFSLNSSPTLPLAMKQAETDSGLASMLMAGLTIWLAITVCSPTRLPLARNDAMRMPFDRLMPAPMSLKKVRWLPLALKHFCHA